MRTQHAVSDIPGAFTTLVGNTPVRFEPCEGRWRARPGLFGVVELWADSYAELRRDVEVFYGRPIRHARQSES